MSIVDLSGTPAVRYPDPPVPRVSPNGTQPLSAYNAACLYYSPRDGEWFGDIKPEPYGVRPIDTLLFGTDYPALVTATASYGENVDGNGPYFPTFNESDPVLGAYAASSVQYIMPTATPAGYKQIAHGLTATNGVAVSGFPYAVNARWHGIAQGDHPTLDAPFLLSLAVVMNAAVVASSTAFYRVEADTRPNMPVIIHESDLTQEIIDAGFSILAQRINLQSVFGSASPIVYLCDLDVVGIWGTNYAPLGG